MQLLGAKRLSQASVPLEHARFLEKIERPAAVYRKESLIDQLARLRHTVGVTETGYAHDPVLLRSRLPRTSYQLFPCAAQRRAAVLPARLRACASRYAGHATEDHRRCVTMPGTIPRRATCSLDTRLIDWPRTGCTPVPPTLRRPHFASAIDRLPVDLPVTLFRKWKQNMCQARGGWH